MYVFIFKVVTCYFYLHYYFVNLIVSIYIITNVMFLIYLGLFFNVSFFVCYFIYVIVDIYAIINVMFIFIL